MYKNVRSRVIVGSGYRSLVSIRPRFHGQYFFDKAENMFVYQFCGEVSLSNICDKGERAKLYN